MNPRPLREIFLTQCECVIQTKLDDRSNHFTMLGAFLSLDLDNNKLERQTIQICNNNCLELIVYFLMPRVLFFSLRYGFLHFLHLVALMSFRALQLKHIFITRRAFWAIRFFSGSVIGIWLSPLPLTFILIGLSHLSCKQYWNFCRSFGNWNVCLVKH